MEQEIMNIESPTRKVELLYYELTSDLFWQKIFQNFDIHYFLFHILPFKTK